MLAAYLQSYFQDEEFRLIFHSVMGTDQPKKVQLLLSQAVSDYLQSSIKEIIFIQSSIGVVFGLLLTNNHKVVLKVYSPKLNKTYLNQINSIQAIFHREGFPSPTTLSPIFKVGRTYAGFYRLIEGDKEDAHRRIICTELARRLAEFSSIVEKHNLSPVENYFQQAERRKLWPLPHNPLFDIKSSTRGAGWITEKSQTGKTSYSFLQISKNVGSY